MSKLLIWRNRNRIKIIFSKILWTWIYKNSKLLKN